MPLLFGLCMIVAVNGFIGTVQEGNVRIFYRFGSLLEQVALPGWHFYMPFVTTMSDVNVRPQTDAVRDVQCGTSDGIVIPFPSIHVGNTLPRDVVYPTIKQYGEDYDTYLIMAKIRHQMQVICSSLTSHEIFLTKFEKLDDDLQAFLKKENEKTGLIIDFVRFPEKPTMPDSIRAQYLMLTEEKGKQQLEIEKQKTLTQKANTERINAEFIQQRELYNTEKQCEIEIKKANKTNTILLNEKENEERMHAIDNRIYLAEEATKAEAKMKEMQALAKGMEAQLNVTGFDDILLLRELGSVIGPNAKFLITGSLLEPFSTFISALNTNP